MKKPLSLFTLIALTIVTVQSFAITPKKSARLQAHLIAPINFAPSIGRNAFVCDTFNNTHATDTLTIYTATDAQGAYSGYISGQNSYGDIAKVDRFANTNHIGGTVSSVILYFGAATASNATDTFNVRVWNEAAGIPGSVLANASYTYQGAVGDVTNNYISLINFTSPPVVQNYFYAGIQFDYITGDTVALVSNTEGETTPATAWELWGDGTTWATFSSSSSWSLNIAQVILPVICDGGTGVESVAYDKTVAVYPTVASNLLNILVGVPSNAVSVRITDMTGRLVIDNVISTMTNHVHQFDISTLESGNYMVNVIIGTYSFSNKIIVQK